ncbi:lipopolysaccharide biosynthesis protein [Paenibacillus tarimensis]|uniref:lipopolysaccharide biosynthesis protein n=1 Tax=Paenibacillus tarimensis TaxID=416012 RepID=UPI001F3913DC|nr:lipopolysaccharide biosynthesis protein [Paenibacillus tarimensis]MCF2944975.1 lipopolysaccharide biosynthesis protein [Paenibacillus tarimensis]
MRTPLAGNAAGRLKMGSFGKQLAVLMSGTALAQVITILSAPVLSRLFTPENFGVFTFYSSIISVLSIVAGGKYEIAVVLPEKDEDAVNVMGLSIMLAFITSLLSALLLGGAMWVNAPITAQMDTWWLLWIPASILAIGIYQSCNYWSTRQKTFRRQSVSQVVRSVGVSGTQLSTGFAGLGGAGLILGQLLGQWVATMTLFVQTWREDGKAIRDKLSMKKMLASIKTYKQFPLFNMPQAFINAMSQQMAPFLLAAYYGSAAVGLYGLSLRLLQMPINVISQSIRQVYLKRASDVFNRKGKQFPLYVKTILSLGAVGILPVCILVVWGPELFAVILGEQWREAGEFARWMILWLYLVYLNPPASVTAQVLNLQQLVLVFEVFLFAARFLALWLGFVYGTALTSIVYYSLTGVLFQMTLIAGMGWFAYRHDKQIKQQLKEVDGK